MQKIIILPEHTAAMLERLCQAEHALDEELIRRALEVYAQKRRQSSLRALFGIWKGRLKVDSLEYVERVREGGAIDELFHDAEAMRKRREDSMRKVFGLWKDQLPSMRTHVDDMRDEWEAHLQELHAPPPKNAH